MRSIGNYQSYLGRLFYQLCLVLAFILLYCANCSKHASGVEAEEKGVLNSIPPLPLAFFRGENGKKKDENIRYEFPSRLDIIEPLMHLQSLTLSDAKGNISSSQKSETETLILYFKPANSPRDEDQLSPRRKKQKINEQVEEGNSDQIDTNQGPYSSEKFKVSSIVKAGEGFETHEWSLEIQSQEPFIKAKQLLKLAKTIDLDAQRRMDLIDKADEWFKKVQGYEFYDIAGKYLKLAKTKNIDVATRQQAITKADDWVKQTQGYVIYQIPEKNAQLIKAGIFETQGQQFTITKAEEWDIEKFPGYSPYEIGLNFLKLARTQDGRTKKQSQALSKAIIYYSTFPNYVSCQKALEYLIAFKNEEISCTEQDNAFTRADEWFKQAQEQGHDPYEIGLKYLNFAETERVKTKTKSQALDKADEWFERAQDRGHDPYKIAQKFLKLAKIRHLNTKIHSCIVDMATLWFDHEQNLGKTPYDIALTFLDRLNANDEISQRQIQALIHIDEWFDQASNYEPHEIVLKLFRFSKWKKDVDIRRYQAIIKADQWFQKANSRHPYKICVQFLKLIKSKVLRGKSRLEDLTMAMKWYDQIPLEKINYRDHCRIGYILVNLLDDDNWEIYFKEAIQPYVDKAFNAAVKLDQRAVFKIWKTYQKITNSVFITKSMRSHFSKMEGLWYEQIPDKHDTKQQYKIGKIYIDLILSPNTYEQSYDSLFEKAKHWVEKLPLENNLPYYELASDYLNCAVKISKDRYDLINALDKVDAMFTKVQVQNDSCFYTIGLEYLNAIITHQTIPLGCLHIINLAKHWFKKCEWHSDRNIYEIGLKYSQVFKTNTKDFRVYNRAFFQAHKWWQQLKALSFENSFYFDIGQSYLQMAVSIQLNKAERLRAIDEAYIWLSRADGAKYDFHQVSSWYVDTIESIIYPNSKLEEKWATFHKWISIINKIHQSIDLTRFMTIAYQLGRYYALRAPHSKLGLYWLSQAETWSRNSTQKDTSEAVIKGWQEQAQDEGELNYLISLLYEVKKEQGTLEEEKSLREEKIIDALKYKDRLIHSKVISPFTVYAPFEVVVIGGGLSGVLSAIQLAKLKDNYDCPLLKVTLLEEKASLMGGASAVPARLHCGGEYPLDQITALDCLHSSLLFLQMIPHGCTDVPAVTYLVHKNTQQEYKTTCQKIKKLKAIYRSVYGKTRSGSGKMTSLKRKGMSALKRKGMSARFFYQTDFPYNLHNMNKKRLKRIHKEIESLKIKKKNLLSIKKVTKRYKKLQGFYEQYYNHLNNGITPNTKNPLFGLPEHFFRELKPYELSQLGLNNFVGGIVTHEKGLNPAKLAAYLMKQLKDAGVNIIYESKVTHVEQKSYGYTVYSKTKSYRADVVVNATFEKAQKLEHKMFPETGSSFQEEKLNVFLRGMLALDISNCKDIPRVGKISLDELKLNEKGKEKVDQEPMIDEETSFFGLLGENGGMFSFFNTHLAWGFWPHENGSYIRWDDPEKKSILSFQISGNKEKDKQQWQCLKVQEQFLLEHPEERLIRAHAIFDNLKKKYPCLEKAVVKDLIVRRIISPSKQTRRQHNIVKCLGREQDWIQAISLKATFSPMTSLQVVRSVLEYMVDKGMGERVWHRKLYVAQQWLKKVYYWMENWQTPPNEVYNGINLPEQFRLPAVSSEQEIELNEQAEKWIAIHSLPPELIH